MNTPAEKDIERLQARITELEYTIDEHRQMEQLLRASAREHRQRNAFITSVVESLNHPFYVIDAHDYTVKMANSAAYEGALPESLTCFALTHRRSAPCTGVGYLCPLEEIKRTRKPAVVEHMHYDKEGNYGVFEVRGYPVLDRDGNVTQIIEYTLDITERKEVERLKEEFISMVSHELRTPLNHIKGFATTLLQTDVEWDTATQRDFLGSINREADRLTSLVEKILHLSSLEAGGLPMEKEWYQVVDLVEGALQRRRNLLDGRQVDLCLAPGLPLLFVDGREIEVVLMNLIENAAKYSDPRAPITLSAERRVNEVVFSVADEGLGIPAEHLEHLFERFYRVNGEGRHGPGGTGLGLAICKRIVEAHDGRIWVVSTPGSGSHFWFSLPMNGTDGSADAPRSA